MMDSLTSRLLLVLPLQILLPSRMHLYTGLVNGLTWLQASVTCQAKGQRLCNYEEVCPYGEGGILRVKGDYAVSSHMHKSQELDTLINMY